MISLKSLKRREEEEKDEEEEEETIKRNVLYSCLSTSTNYIYYTISLSIAGQHCELFSIFLLSLFGSLVAVVFVFLCFLHL